MKLAKILLSTLALLAGVQANAQLVGGSGNRLGINSLTAYFHEGVSDLTTISNLYSGPSSIRLGNTNPPLPIDVRISGSAGSRISLATAAGQTLALPELQMDWLATSQTLNLNFNSNFAVGFQGNFSLVDAAGNFLGLSNTVNLGGLAFNANNSALSGQVAANLRAYNKLLALAASDDDLASDPDFQDSIDTMLNNYNVNLYRVQRSFELKETSFAYNNPVGATFSFSDGSTGSFSANFNTLNPVGYVQNVSQGQGTLIYFGLTDITTNYRPFSPVPEPSTYGALGALSLLGLVGVRKLRRTKTA